MNEVSPYKHPCDVGTIDYSNVKLGQLKCRVCERTWKLTPRGWLSYPTVRYKPK